MIPVRFTVTGAPRTKKTSNQIVIAGGRRRVLPSKAWREWMNAALFVDGRVAVRWTHPIVAPVNCRAVFYRDANRGDAVGYYQGLADLLEKRGVVENDRFIVSWDGSRLDVDRKNPRTEVVLEAVGEQ